MKKVVDGMLRADDKPPPSPTTSPLLPSEALAADFEQETGQEPGQPGDRLISLFLIVGLK
jgi:hypothetical protein